MARRATVEDTDFSQAFMRTEILSVLVLKVTFVPCIIDAAWTVPRFVFEIGQKIKVGSKVKIWSFDGGCHVKEETNVSELGNFRMEQFVLEIIKGPFGVQKQILEFNEIFHCFLFDQIVFIINCKTNGRQSLEIYQKNLKMFFLEKGSELNQDLSHLNDKKFEDFCKNSNKNINQ